MTKNAVDLGTENKGSSRSITIAYLIGLVLIASLATGVWFMTIVLVSSQEQVGVEVNVAGRQRMLSQRIAVAATSLQKQQVFEDRTPSDLLMGCADLMERAHFALLERDVKTLQATASEGISCQPGEIERPELGQMSAEIEDAHFGGDPSLDALVTRYIGLARSIAADGGNKPEEIRNLLLLAYLEVPLKLNAMLATLQREGEVQVQDLRSYKTMMWLTTLLLLVLEVLIIFRPLSRKVRESEAGMQLAIHELTEREQELETANRLILDSIEYARRIQLGLLPPEMSLSDTVEDLHMLWEPLHVVSGDYFWVEERGPFAIFFIADCTGHGVPGAFMTMVTAAAVERLLEEEEEFTDPGEFLLRLDRRVRTRLKQDEPGEGEAVSDDGLEAAICFYDSRTGILSYAGAGIPLIRLMGGLIRETRPDRHRIGYRSIRKPSAFETHEVAVNEGDRIYLFTDGVTDHVGGPRSVAFGRKRVRDHFQRTARQNLKEQIMSLKSALTAYLGEEGRRDDLALLAVTFKAPTNAHVARHPRSDTSSGSSEASG